MRYVGLRSIRGSMGGEAARHITASNESALVTSHKLGTSVENAQPSWLTKWSELLKESMGVAVDASRSMRHYCHHLLLVALRHSPR